MTIISALIATILPLIAGAFIDDLLSKMEVSIIYKFIIIYLSLSLFNLALGFLISKLGMIIKTTITYNLNKDILENIKYYSLFKVEKMDLSQLNQQISADCGVCVNYFFSLMSNFVVNTAIIIVISFFLFFISKYLFAIVFIIIIMFLLWYQYFKKYVYHSQKMFTIENYKLYAALYEQLSSIKINRLFGLNNFFNNRIELKFTDFFKSAKKNQVINFMFSSSETIAILFGQLGLFLIGGYSIINKEITIGIYSILSNYFNLLIGSAKYFSNLSKEYQNMKVSYDRLKDLLVDERENQLIFEDNTINTIELKKLTFCYKQKKIFENLNFSFEKNKIYCICGPNGFGKSTLINLISGLYNFDYFGDILINDVNVKKINLNKVIYRYFRVVTQKPLLINDTIRNNLKFDKQYTDKQLISVLEEFNFKIDEEKNLDTMIGFSAGNLSGGELQKISLARSLLGEADVYIFDEPTTYLDDDTKKILITKLRELSKEKIVIIISHDEKIIKISDEIIKLDKKIK